MPPEINLLPQRKKRFLSEERLLLFTKVTAVVSLVLVVSLSLAFFLLSRDPRDAQLKAQQSRFIAQLSLLQSKAAKYLIIVDRVNKIKTITKNRTNLDGVTTTLLQEIAPGVSVTNFALDKNSLSLAVSSSDLSLIGKTVNNFSSLLASKKILKTLTIQGLVSDEKSGTYVLTLTATL